MIRRAYTTRERILRYLLRTRPAEFTARDIAKPLNLTAGSIGGYLKDMPEVQVLDREIFEYSSGCANRYRLVIQEAA